MRLLEVCSKGHKNQSHSKSGVGWSGFSGFSWSGNVGWGLGGFLAVGVVVLRMVSRLVLCPHGPWSFFWVVGQVVQLFQTRKRRVGGFVCSFAVRS